MGSSPIGRAQLDYPFLEVEEHTLGYYTIGRAQLDYPFLGVKEPNLCGHRYLHQVF